MFRKLFRFFGILSLLLLCLAVGLRAHLYFKEKREAAYVAEVENEFPFIPLPEPADPNGFKVAAEAFNEAFEAAQAHESDDDGLFGFPKNFDLIPLYTLATNALLRLPGYVPEMDEDGLERNYHGPFLICMQRFYSVAFDRALKAHDKQRFQQLLAEFQTACDALPEQFSTVEALLAGLWFSSLAHERVSLGAFDSASIEELQTALDRFPSDEKMTRFYLDAIENDYHHRFLRLLDSEIVGELEESIRKKKRSAVSFLLYSRPATEANALRYLRRFKEIIPLQADARGAPVEEVLQPTFGKRRWYHGNLVGGMILGMSLPESSFADRARDSINLCRLGLACQIFYRRHGRPPASFEALLSDGILTALPIRYSEGDFTLILDDGPPRIVVGEGWHRTAFRIVSPDPETGGWIIDEEETK